MASKHIALCCALLAFAGGSACAVTGPAGSAARCSVESGEKLPAQSGGAEALCAEIEGATANLAPLPTVAVRVVRPGVLAATVTRGGRTLPEIKMARFDRELDRAAFKRFAQAIVKAAAATD